MKSHIKAVHRDGGFDMKTWIKCGLRSFGLTFRTSRSARRVPQLAALALHTAGSTAQASQFGQSWLGSIMGGRGSCKTTVLINYFICFICPSV